MTIKMFVLERCPHCIKARTYLSELLSRPKYQGIEVEIIDEIEEAELADSYDYYYVPTFFIGNKKLFEGSMTYDDVNAVLDEVVEDVAIS